MRISYSLGSLLTIDEVLDCAKIGKKHRITKNPEIRLFIAFLSHFFSKNFENLDKNFVIFKIF